MSIVKLNIATSKDQLYVKLSELHRPVMPADFSLVVEYHSDVINNSTYPGKYLTNLVEILSELDFPTFFVSIATKYENIHRDLEHLNSLFNNGLIKVIDSAEPFSLIKEKKDTFCVLPWMHFYFNPQGQINPCCMSDLNYPLGNFKNEDPDFNSNKIIEFRNTLLAGEEAPQCSVCYKNEAAGVISFRQQVNQRFAQHIPEDPAPVVADFKLKYIDIRLSNLCNLKCRMCDGNFSSKIAAEDFNIWGISKFLHNSNSTAYDEQLVKLVEKHIEHIEHIYFAGGEPLINSFHYDILDLLIKHNKTNVKISYNTNFSIINKALPYWQKFSNVTIGASIDLCGPAADYVRNGVDYDTLKNNYNILKNTCPDVEFKITSVLSLYNVFNLCNLQEEWISSIGLPADKISFSILTSPENMAISVLPQSYKKLAVERINKHLNYLNDCSAGKLIDEWNNALRFMLEHNDEHLLASFFKLNTIRDQARNQVFESYFPEFQNLRNSLQ